MPEADPSIERTAAFVQRLQRQVRLCEQLDALTRQHAVLLAAGQVEQLEKLLGRRRQVIAQLAPLVRALAAEREALARDGPAGQGEQTLRRRADELLAGVLESDAHMHRDLAEARSRTADELRQVRRAGTTRRAYRKGPRAGNRFMNQQG